MTVISSIVGASLEACAAPGSLVVRNSAEQSDTTEARARMESNVTTPSGGAILAMAEEGHCAGLCRLARNTPQPIDMA